MSDEEFYGLTPRKFSELMKRHKHEVEYRELLNGILASLSVNFSLGAPKQPTTPADFMPSQWKKKVAETPKKQRMTKEQRANIAASVRGIFKGLIARQEAGKSNG